MQTLTGATWLLLICASVLAHIRIDVPELHFGTQSPTFVRAAVESLPPNTDSIEQLSRYSMRPTFGEVFLPLRSAVESVPTVNIENLKALKDSNSQRAFVRDSVEAVPTNDELNSERYLTESSIYNDHFENLNKPEKFKENHSNSKLKSMESPDPSSNLDNFAASVDASKANTYFSKPFRSESPYQELLKAFDVEQLELIEDIERVKEQLSHGSLSDAASAEEKRPYGALAAAKVTKNYNISPKVLCYVTNWSFYRKADGKFVPEHLDKTLCTTIIYSFASLDPDHFTIKEFDPYVDIDNQYYSRIVKSGIPVLVSMGGWTDSAGDKYSRLAGDEIKRKVFASNLVGYLLRNGFSGLHLDWNYPKCWQSDCSKGPSVDKPNLTKLMREIRMAFDRTEKKLELGVAISGYKEIINEAYEFQELSKVVDYLTVMSYDYHGAWERQTGHVSPLYGKKTDKYPQYNTDYTMQLLVKLGAKKEKLILGIPFYGQSFTLQHESMSLVGEGTPSIGPGEPGEFTKQPGMLAYYEICQRIRKHKWLTGRDIERKSGPYAMLRNQWVGYEDPASVEAKARYAVNNGYGGIAAWTVDLDDFQNRCCSESYPLLKAINRAVGRLSSPPPYKVNCDRPPQPVTPEAPIMTTTSSDGSSSANNHDHTTSRPSWNSTSSTTALPVWSPSTSRRPLTTPTTPKTTQQTSTAWWSTTSATTTRRPTTTQWPIWAAQQPDQTTIPSPAVVRPVIQTTNCQAGQFYADHFNCNAYYQCITAGELRQQFCPGGLHWNDHTKNCDWPSSAQCSVKKKPIQSSIMPTISTTSRPTWSQSSSTVSTPRPSKQTTPITTTRWPYFSTTTSTQYSITHRTTKKPQRPPFERPSSKCNEGEYYTHKNCGQYYICVNGALVPNSCGSNLHWDAIRETCDWPENVQCIATEQYLRIVKAKANSSDLCNGEERIPYPGDCSKYLFCLWNRLQGADCPPGLHFNSAAQLCDWPSQALCDESGGDGAEAPVLIQGENGLAHPKPSRPVHAKPPTTTKRPEIITTTPRVTFPTDKPILEPLSGYYKVVCYFTNWAWYRKGLGRYTPDDINTDLCTHIVYGFAVLDYSNLIIRTHDSWADIDNNFYTRVSGLRNKGIKVSLALGGWNDSQGDKYSRLVRSPQARARFIKHAIEFIEKYGFEGLDLDWEYPVCWQTECNKGMADEKQAFTAWVRELSEAFKPRGLLLSTAVSPSKKIIDAGYEVPQLSHYFDWIAVMTYDFHGQWDKKTGHVAPLYYHPDDEIDYFNANFSIHYWIEKGAPPRKIVMGMPLYGQSFTLENAKNNGLNAKAPGPGQAGEFTKAAGFLAYYEICDRIQNHGWEVVQDELGRMGPYARKGTQWVSFDDPIMIRKKSHLVRALDLGGGMVWALDLDDFRNRCGHGVHPLLREIHNVLKDPPNGYKPKPGVIPMETESVEEQSVSKEEEIGFEIETGSDQENVQEQPFSENAIDPNEGVEEGDSETQQLSDSESSGTGTDSKDDFKVVCYFTNWAWYRQGGGKFLPEDIDPELCTHIVYGFAVLNRDSLTIQPHDSWADLDNKFYNRVVALRSRGVKVTVALGGWNDSAGDKYARLVRNPSARARFVSNVITFIEKYEFDGLDLDWEYPVCWQVDCKKGTADEKQSFTALVRELAREFKPKGLLLSSAVSPNKKVIDAGYDVQELSHYFDWIAVMTYDYHGQWDKKTGHVAPMYDHPDGTATFNANFSINYWLQKGAERKKIVMGMPMYGQSFSLAHTSEHDLNAPTYGGGEAGEATRSRGFLAYYEICSYIQNRGWNVVRDPRGRMGPYAYLRDQWVSFDDAPMIRHKSEYVRAMGLAGAMIWALDLDDFKNKCNCESYPLLKTINRVLRNYPGPQPTCVLEQKEKTMIATVGGASQAYVANIPQHIDSPHDQNLTADIDPIKKPDCDGRDFAPHEQDCNKYYVCQHGGLLEQRCPEGLHWNDFFCDWPQNADCNVRMDENFNAAAIKRPNPTVITLSNDESLNITNYSIKPLHTRPITKPTLSPILNEEHDYKVICYFTNHAWYRPGQGKFVPEDIDENLCTHIVYAFAVLDSNLLTIRTYDFYADIDNKFYQRVIAYKRKGLKVSLAIGGWNDSVGRKYARLVLDPESRARFVDSVLLFIEKYGFDGLDLDWEFPACPHVNCTKGLPGEKEGFVALVHELSDAFKGRGLLLSASVSPSKTVIDYAYDIPALAKYFDWIGVMTYDYHGSFDKQTGHIAPLYYRDDDVNKFFNCNFTIHYYLEKGAPRHKLIMGMPLYGQTFTLADPKYHTLNQLSIGPGQAGTYTRAAGFLAYYEICENVNNGGWSVTRDPQGHIGPYAFNGNQWISYDDVEDIRRKSQYIKSMGLGGGMVWALDLDDFRGRCGCGKYPLLRTLNQELRSLSGQRAYDCT